MTPSPIFANRFIFFFILYEILVSVLLSGLNSVFLQTIIFVVPVIVYFVITKQNPKRILKFSMLNFKTILVLILIGVMIQPVMSLFSSLAHIFFQSPTDNMANELLSKPLIVILITSGLMPPVFEEIVMRGIFLSNYSKIKYAAVINGLVFAILHFSYQQFMYAMIMGIVFCYVVNVTGSILSSIIIHATFNISQTLMMFLQLKGKLPSVIQILFLSDASDLKSFVFIIISSFIFAIAVWFLIKRLPKVTDDNEIEHGGSFFSWHLLVVFALYVLLAR